MTVLVDDVGSFPLPSRIDRQAFNRARDLARKALIDGKDLWKDEFLRDNFCRVVIDSFKRKLESGLDVVNYPQHCDMYEQFAEVIREAMSEGSYIVDEKLAVIPEVHVIDQEAKKLYEEYGHKVRLRACATGPMELYLKQVGTALYEDVLLMFSETVRRFARNAVLDSKYIKTEAVSIDEPSFGFQEIGTDRNAILGALEKAFDFSCETKQIHLHSSAKAADLLDVKNLDVLTFEYAGSPRNIESVSKKMLERVDKQVRVGISRTDIDSIVAELHDKGLTEPTPKQLVEDVEIMQRRLVAAKEKYGDRMVFTGPDCGLGGWPNQEAAELLLKRTVDAARRVCH
jgi:5-methyltetrahydropteroyltriglutamate--homocysteine methyltransferase